MIIKIKKTYNDKKIIIKIRDMLITIQILPNKINMIFNKARLLKNSKIKTRFIEISFKIGIKILTIKT